MKPVTRFAPSPTGKIHIGNVRTALFNWLFAKAGGGDFILRFDDTDLTRSKPEFVEAIERDLRWLGVGPDRVEFQSKRFDAYQAAVDTLIAAGRLYPAYETPDELDRRRKRQRTRGLPPVYDRAALKLTGEEKTELEAEGRKPHWRFLLDNHDGDPFQPRPTPVIWNDLCRGEQTIDLSAVSDPVLVREDGTYLYTLPSVVDDRDMSVTHVIRGEDHVTNTAVQLDLFKALGADAPVFAHHNLLTLPSGEGLSKRMGHLSIESLREESGLEPMTIAVAAVLIGTSEAVAPYASLSELGTHFDLAKVSRAPAKFDPEDLSRLNGRVLQELTYADVAERLEAVGADGGEMLWNAIRGNLVRFADAKDWFDVVNGEVEAEVEAGDAPVIAAAVDALPAEPWDDATFKTLADAVKGLTGAKGKALFMPLRKAITGRASGPEMGPLLPLIGREKVISRLRASAQ